MPCAPPSKGAAKSDRYQYAHDFAESHRGNREIVPAYPQYRKAEDHTHQHSQQHRDWHSQPEGQMQQGVRAVGGE